MKRLRIHGVMLNCRIIEPPERSPASLLLHGLNANMAFWHPALLSSLRQQRRLVLQDLRGHGYSGMPSTGYTPANLAVDACVEARADLVAHSFGSNVALQLARLHPDRVRTLTLLDARVRLVQPYLRIGDWARFERWRKNFEDAGIRIDPDWEFDHTLPLKMSGGDFAEASRLLAADGFFPPSSGTRTAARYRKLISETSAGEEFLDKAGLTLDSLRAMTTPTLLVYGTHSPFLPTRDGLLREIPQCRCEMIEGGGHNFPFLMPGQTAEAIELFWASAQVEETMTP